MANALRKLRDIFDRPTKIALIVATFASMILALLDTVAVALVLPLVNLATGTESSSGPLGWVTQLLPDEDRSNLILVLATFIVALFIIKDIGSLAYSWWFAGFKAQKRVLLSTRLLRHYLTSPYTLVSQRSSSELIRTMSDAVVQLFGSSVYGLMGVVTNVINILALSAALLLSAPVPTLAALAYFTIAAVTYQKTVKPRAERAGRISSTSAQGAWRSAFAALGALKEVRLRGTHDFFVDNYKKVSLENAAAARTSEFLTAIPRYFLEILFILAVGIILVVATWTQESEQAASSGLGVLALFVAAGLRMIPALTALLGNLNGLRFGAPYLDLVHREVLAARDLGVLETSPPRHLMPFTRSLALHDVAFRYPGAHEQAIKSVTFTVPLGSSVAIVGGSGAGKTTLVDVILGLHQPTSGYLQVDGDILRGREAEWQAGIGYVPQDVYLLDASLAENIAFDQALTDVDEELLKQVVAQAQLSDLVASLPDGLATYVGERGSRLSGGQRQRVGIARALYRRPRLLVLDEATSALDNLTEHRISETLQDLRGSLTTIVVAHRLSTVRHVDVVVFMRDGQIEAMGSFEEVQAHSADFRRLVQLGSLS